MELALLLATSGPQKSLGYQGPPFPMALVMDLPASNDKYIINS